jgi:hypothetical protein
MKSRMTLKWHDEHPRPIDRGTAAMIIRGNRRAPTERRIIVRREGRATVIGCGPFAAFAIIAPTGA